MRYSTHARNRGQQVRCGRIEGAGSIGGKIESKGQAGGGAGAAGGTTRDGRGADDAEEVDTTL